MIRARHLFALALALFSVGVARDGVDHWVGATDLPPLTVENSVEVRDRDGVLLRAFQVENGRWRLNASRATTDPRFVEMLIRFEDKRFFDHGGVDPYAMIRATGQALWHGEVVSGGSTLSMQVARLLEHSGTGSWRGKLRQIRVALALERRLSKSQILDIYLNRAPYGGNLEGIASASRAYFGKPPRRLTPAEAGLLVALPQSPEARRPDRNPRAAQKARDRVLRRLYSMEVLTSEALNAAVRETVPTKRLPFPQIAPHVAERLKDTGQIVTTTLDASLQRKIERLAQSAVQPLADDLSVAVMVADHRTGEILASLGSARYANTGNAGFVDMTRAIRSPGSTLKPLVYGLAFDRGLAHPETLIADRPQQFGTYAPQNFDGRFRGEVSIREALQASLNLPVVSITDTLGPAVLLGAMTSAGLKPVVPGGKPGLAVALGGVGVTLSDLMTLYAAIARGGTAQELRLRPYEAQSETQILSPRAAWYLSDILRDVPPPNSARTGKIAFKTGTSYGHRDAWAIGYDGAHVVGVWMGRPDGTPVPGAFGGELAAPLLFETFDKIGAITPLPPAPADALIVGRQSLPPQLRNFGQPAASTGPVMAFPPDGAQVEADDALVVARIRDGRAPFTWLANGVPVAIQSRAREQDIAVPGRGFLDITVIDAAGQSVRSRVFVN